MFFPTLCFPPLRLSTGYPFTQHPEGATDAIECTEPKAWGWLSVPFFLVVIILGAYVLPTVLVGIVSISFEEANKTAEVVEEMAKGVDNVVVKMQHELPAFFEGGRMDRVRRSRRSFERLLVGLHTSFLAVVSPHAIFVRAAFASFIQLLSTLELALSASFHSFVLFFHRMFLLFVSSSSSLFFVPAAVGVRCPRCGWQIDTGRARDRALLALHVHVPVQRGADARTARSPFSPPGLGTCTC